MSGSWVLDLILLIAVGLGCAWAVIGRGRPMLERVAAGVGPPLGVIAFGAYAWWWLHSFHLPWYDARLAPAAAWLAGYELYYGAGEGPILGAMYPPMAAWAYLPAAAMPTPFSAVAVGVILAMAMYFAPSFWVLASERHAAHAAWTITLLTMCGFALYTNLSPPIVNAAVHIHADAPAMGFAALACGAMTLRGARRRRWPMIVSAAAAVLAVLSKQVMAPLLVAVPLCWLIFDGRRAMMRSVIHIAAAAAIAAVVLLASVDAAAMILNIIVIPSRHPWSLTIGQASIELALHALPWLAACGAYIIIARPKSGDRLFQWLRTQRWLAWLIVAALMAPTSVLGRVKTGGVVNTLAPTIFPLAIACHVLVIRLWTDVRTHRSNRWRTIVRIVLLIALAVPAAGAWRQMRSAPNVAKTLPDNPLRRAFEFERENPGVAYFPFNPLIGLKAQGKAYHFSDGVLNRFMARVDVPQEQLAAYVPPNAQMIVVYHPQDFATVYLPRFSTPIELPQFPGMQAYVEPYSPLIEQHPPR